MINSILIYLNISWLHVFAYTLTMPIISFCMLKLQHNMIGQTKHEDLFLKVISVFWTINLVISSALFLTGWLYLQYTVATGPNPEILLLAP